MTSRVILILLCMGAVWQDLRTRKIENKYQLFAMTVGVCSVAITGDISGRECLFGFLMAVVSGFFLWKVSAIGAGDAKFLWTVGILFGGSHMPIFLGMMLLWGAVIGLSLCLYRSWKKRGFCKLEKKEFPFSLAILFGVINTVLMQFLG